MIWDWVIHTMFRKDRARAIFFENWWSLVSIMVDVRKLQSVDLRNVKKVPENESDNWPMLRGEGEKKFYMSKVYARMDIFYGYIGLLCTMR